MAETALKFPAPGAQLGLFVLPPDPASGEVDRQIAEEFKDRLERVVREVVQGRPGVKARLALTVVVGKDDEGEVTRKAKWSEATSGTAVEL